MWACGGEWGVVGAVVSVCDERMFEMKEETFLTKITQFMVEKKYSLYCCIILLLNFAFKTCFFSHHTYIYIYFQTKFENKFYKLLQLLQLHYCSVSILLLIFPKSF